MTTNIDGLNIDQLEELTEKAKLLIEQKKREKIDVAYQQLLDVAQSVGFTLDELVAHGQQSKKAVVKRTVAPRYQNPQDKDQTWTGRGKQPRWVVEALAKGKTLDDLSI